MMCSMVRKVNLAGLSICCFWVRHGRLERARNSTVRHSTTKTETCNAQLLRPGNEQTSRTRPCKSRSDGSKRSKKSTTFLLACTRRAQPAECRAPPAPLASCSPCGAHLRRRGPSPEAPEAEPCPDSFKASLSVCVRSAVPLSPALGACVLKRLRRLPTTGYSEGTWSCRPSPLCCCASRGRADQCMVLLRWYLLLIDCVLHAAKISPEFCTVTAIGHAQVERHAKNNFCVLLAACGCESKLSHFDATDTVLEGVSVRHRLQSSGGPSCRSQSRCPQQTALKPSCLWASARDEQNLDTGHFVHYQMQMLPALMQSMGLLGAPPAPLHRCF